MSWIFKTVSLSNYSIDTSFENILKVYKIQPNPQPLDEESKIDSSNVLSLEQTLGPNHRFCIHRDGSWFCYDSKLDNLSDLLSVKKMKEKTIADSKLKSTLLTDEKLAILNDEKGASEFLKSKDDRLSDFQNSTNKSVESTSNSEAVADFCLIKLLEDPEKRMSHKSYFSNMAFWFPTLQPEKQFLRVELVKEDLSGTQSFNYYSYIIKIPEVGCWITGGVQNVSGPKVVNDCYEVALINCTISGQLKCIKKPDLKKPTFSHAGVCAGDHIYISGGSDGGALLNETYRINWKNPLEWESRSPMLKPRLYHSLLNIGSKIYCFGGGDQKIEKGSPKFEENSSVDEYNIDADKWSTLSLGKKADSIWFIPASYMFVQPLSDRKVLICGGVDCLLETSLVGSYIYDFNDNTFTKPKQDVKSLPKSPMDFIDLNSVRANNTLYFFGPYKSTFSKFFTSLYSFGLHDHKCEPKRKNLDSDVRINYQ